MSYIYIMTNPAYPGYVKIGATKLLGIERAVQGTLYFKYNGETLSDRRERLENEGLYK